MKNIKYLCISVLLVLFSIFTFLQPVFMISNPTDMELVFTRTGNKDSDSAGTEVRISKIKINDQEISWNELQKDGGWFEDGKLLVSYAPDIQASVKIKTPKLSTLEVDYVKQNGSGTLNIQANGIQLTELDLYAATDWEEAPWIYQIPKSFSPFSRLDIILELIILTFIFINVIEKYSLSITKKVMKFNTFDEKKSLILPVGDSNRNLWLFVFIINLTVIMLTYALLLQPHFSADTYDIFVTHDNNVDVHLRDGRFITAICYWILAKIGINVARQQTVFVLIFIVLTAFLITFLTRYVLLHSKRKEWKILLVTDMSFTLLFCNVFIGEWYLWPEVMLMYAIALCTAIFSAINMFEAFDSKHINFIKMLKALLLLFISLGSYQVTISIYIVLLMILLLVKEKFNLSKYFIKSSFYGLLAGELSCFINLFTVKLITIIGIMKPTTRGTSFSVADILYNLKEILRVQVSIWKNADRLLPDYLFVIFFLVLAIILFFSCQNKLKQFIFICIILVIEYLAVFIPHYVSANIWIKPRTLVGIFGIFTTILLAIIYQTKNFKIYTMLSILGFMFIATNIFNVWGIAYNHLKMDKLDVQYAQNIQKFIEEYEKEKNIKIENLALCLDEQPTWSYPGVNYVSYDINVKNILRDWAFVPLMNARNNKNYKKTDMSEEIYNKYFKTRNWDNFEPDDQIIFSGNTAYVCIY